MPLGDLGERHREVADATLGQLAVWHLDDGVMEDAATLDEVLQSAGEDVLLLILDGVQDTHNLGALIRTACAAGANAVVLPERRAAGLTPAVVQAASGAIEHLPVVRVGNLARTLDELKEHAFWIYGLDEKGGKSYDEADYRGRCALVAGGEAKGLHDLLKKKCDFLVRIPAPGKIATLNVSVAAGIVLFEAARQRRGSLATEAQRLREQEKRQKGE